MFKNHLTLGYILLVGVPLVILAGTLRAGARLAALPAISGQWVVERAPGNCASLGSAFSVQQLGPDVAISFADPRTATLTGALEGGRLSAAGGGLRLEAAISGSAARRSWQGSVWTDSCPPVPFRATKAGK